MNKERVKLGDVQETLLIPLWARAVEAKKRKPILLDEKAVEVMNRIDYDFSVFSKAKGSQVGCCLRGVIMDEMLRASLKQHPDTVVVEVGAGLDTRYERLEGEVRRWFDLDLQDSMTLRRQFFAETSNRTFISGSVLDKAWIAEVKNAARSAPVVFVIEGVLVYFTEAQVRQLFCMLADEFPGAALIFDSMGTAMVKNQKHHDSVKHTNAKFVWGINNIRDLSQWDKRFRVIDSVSFYGAPRAARRVIPFGMHVMLLMAALMKYRMNKIQFVGE